MKDFFKRLFHRNEHCFWGYTTQTSSNGQKHSVGVYIVKDFDGNTVDAYVAAIGGWGVAKLRIDHNTLIKHKQIIRI